MSAFNCNLFMYISFKPVRHSISKIIAECTMIIIVVRNIVQENLNSFILLLYTDLFIYGKYVHSNVQDLNILHWVFFAIGSCSKTREERSVLLVCFALLKPHKYLKHWQFCVLFIIFVKTIWCVSLKILYGPISLLKDYWKC